MPQQDRGRLRDAKFQLDEASMNCRTTMNTRRQTDETHRTRNRPKPVSVTGNHRTKCILGPRGYSDKQSVLIKAKTRIRKMVMCMAQLNANKVKHCSPSVFIVSNYRMWRKVIIIATCMWWTKRLETEGHSRLAPTTFGEVTSISHLQKDTVTLINEQRFNLTFAVDTVSTSRG